MARRRIDNDDLDEKFDQFLQESMSDDEALEKLLQKKKKKDEKQPWWMTEGGGRDDDDIAGDDDANAYLGTSTQSFLKKKKDPKPATRSFLKKTPSSNEQAKSKSDGNQESKEKEIQPKEKPTKNEEDEQNYFKKDFESSDEEVVTGVGMGNKKSTGDARKQLQVDMTMSRDSLDEPSGYKATISPVLSESEFQPSATEDSLYRGSLQGTQDTLGDMSTKAHSTPKYGQDTLDEIADKENFFKNLEKANEDSVDFSKLNKDLEKTNTFGTNEAGKQDLMATGVETPDTTLTKANVTQSEEQYDKTLDEIKALRRELEDPMESLNEPNVLDILKPAESQGQGHALSSKEPSVFDLLKPATGEQETVSKEPSVFDLLQPVSSQNDLVLPDKDQEQYSSDYKGHENVQRSVFDLLQPAEQSVHREDEEKRQQPVPSPRTHKPSLLSKVSLLEDTIDGTMGSSKLKKTKGLDTEYMGTNTQQNMQDLQEALQGMCTQESSLEMTHGTSGLGKQKSDHKSKGNKLKGVKSRIDNKWQGKPGSQRDLTGGKTGGQDAWSPAHTAKSKFTGVDRGPRAKPTLGGSQLKASVESFANYIQSHFSPEGKPPRVHPQRHQPQDVDYSTGVSQIGVEREEALVREAKEWQEQWREERKLVAKLKLDLTSQEQMYLAEIENNSQKYEKELFDLKQENFLLSAKVAAADTSEPSVKRKILNGQSIEGASEEQLKRFEQEIREQEKLLQGYQQENEKLYKELKSVQSDGKVNRDKIFRENQRLNSQVINLRSQVERLETELSTKGGRTITDQQIVSGSVNSAVLGAGRIAQLNAELKQSKTREGKLKFEISTLEQTRRELEKHIEMLVAEGEDMRETMDKMRSLNTDKDKETQRELLVEVERLKKRVKWYAENQDLLDRDASIIQTKEEEIVQLKKQLAQIRNKASEKENDIKMKAKERSTESKKIQDLQRQVKELEGILKKRNPNSLPALMWAAAAVPDTPTEKSHSVKFLEGQIDKLEKQLEKKDEDCKHSLRVMEQKYEAVKMQYEDRIDTLEKQTAGQSSSHPHTHGIALQKELDSVRERYKKHLAELTSELEKLKKELQHQKMAGVSKSELKAMQDSESSLLLKLQNLQKELANRNSEILLLQDRLSSSQKEKQQILVDSARHEAHIKGEKRAKKTSRKSHSGQKSTVPEPTPLEVYSDPYSVSKAYTPDTFAGAHISDVLAENEQLKLKVERLQLEGHQERVDLNKVIAEGEAVARRDRENLLQELNTLRQENAAEKQLIINEHSLQYSNSKLAELQNTIDSQQVMLKHLKQQTKDLKIDRDDLAASRIREAALEMEVKQLRNELREARETQSPEMKHFNAIQNKIAEMEQRHSQREQELRQIIRNTQMQASTDNAAVTHEVEKWRAVVDVKNKELEQFRKELDSILGVLQELHKQGVVLPIRNNNLTPGPS